VVDSIKFIEED